MLTQADKKYLEWYSPSDNDDYFCVIGWTQNNFLLLFLSSLKGMLINF